MSILNKSKWLLKETEFSKTPTDKELDNIIIYVNDILKHIYPLILFIFKKKIYRFIKYRLLSIKSWFSFFIRLFIVIFILTIIYLISDTTYTIIDKRVINIGNNNEQIVEKILYRSDLKPYDDFIHSIGESESSNVWDKTRLNSQYIGWFQFGNAAFEECKKLGLDVDKYGKNNFLNNPNAQKLWFEALLRTNRKYLSDIILKWNFKHIKNVKSSVTESGILMGAHLVGHSACRTFFESNGDIIPKDGNGVPITVYIEKFSGYELPSRI